VGDLIHGRVEKADARREAKIRVAKAYAVALIKAERKSEWTGMMNLGLLEGDKSHWMGEYLERLSTVSYLMVRPQKAVSVLKHQKQ
jgi:hypothetical protein